VTPFEVMFGRNAKLPIDIFYKSLTSEEQNSVRETDRESPTIEQKYVKELSEYLKKIYLVASTNQEIKMEKAKIWYDRQATKPTFKQGDLVLVRNSQSKIGKSKKLSYRFNGPYEIVEVIGELNYKLKLVQQVGVDKKLKNRPIMRHYNLLKKFKGQLVSVQEINSKKVKTPRGKLKQRKQTKNGNTTNKEQTPIIGELEKEHENNEDRTAQTSEEEKARDKSDRETEGANVVENPNENSNNSNEIISDIIEKIIDHKAVKNSFHLLVRYKNQEREDEWVPKSKIEKAVLDKDIDMLPEKSLKKIKLKATRATEPTRRSARLQLKESS
jgi:hypothetical protein